MKFHLTPISDPHFPAISPSAAQRLCDMVLWCKIALFIIPPRIRMSRLTITLSEERYCALKQAAAQRGSSIGRLIDAALDHYGIKPREQAIALVQRARAASALDDAPAVELALHEQNAVRARRRAQ